jgi:hypothetical protein
LSTSHERAAHDREICLEFWAKSRALSKKPTRPTTHDAHIFNFTADTSSLLPSSLHITTANMASKNTLPSIFNATAQDIEMLLSAQCHIGAKNLQVHMEPYLWKTRPDGVNIINIGKTW